MRRNLSLWFLLSTAVVASLIVTVSIFYAFIIHQTIRQTRNNEEHLILAIGQQVASEPRVKKALLADEPSTSIQNYSLKISRLYHLDFVVLMDMSSIRLTHPDQSEIGKRFIGGDEKKALRGKIALSVSHGTLGKSLRGFIPVYYHKKQIGVIALGIKVTSLSNLVAQSRQQYITALVISSLFGLLIALNLAFYLKKQLHDLEPQEIARLLEERDAMLEQSKDAIAIIDSNQRILLANIEAKKIYSREGYDVSTLVGQQIDVLIAHKEQINFNKKREQFYQQNGQDYLFSATPIIVRGNQTGYAVFLRNATEALFVADQLANTTAYASALQSQSHEFMNKLHIIYGLADLKAYDELKIYLQDIIRPEKEFAHKLALLVRNPVIASFFIGEREKFTEKKTQLKIEFLTEIPANESKKETTAFIELCRYLDHYLLQSELPDEFNLVLQFQDRDLIAVYSLTHTSALLNILENALGSFYFKQLLKENHASISLDQRHSILEINLKSPYGKDEHHECADS